MDSEDKKVKTHKNQWTVLAGLLGAMVLLVYGGWLLRNSLSGASEQKEPLNEQRLVNARLLADTSAISNGKPFTLGVFLEIEPGWHVYWRNPGDSGLATIVNMSLPEGFEVSPIEYPLPVRFTQPGDIIGYGYHDSVLLTAQVMPPENLAVGSEVNIKAELSYLVCKERCVPGTQSLALTLPVAEDTQANHKELFDDWAQRMPREPGAPDSPRIVSITGEIDAGARAATFKLQLEWEYPIKSIQCFPEVREDLTIDNFDINTQGRNSEITFTVEILSGQLLANNKLDLLITATGVDTDRVGINVSIPLRSEEVNNHSIPRLTAGA